MCPSAGFVSSYWPVIANVKEMKMGIKPICVGKENNKIIFRNSFS